MFEMIASAMGGIIVLLLTYLITTTNGLRKDLNKHILEMTKELSRKISISDCATRQQKCVGLNEIIIKEPLKDEDKALWHAIKHHTHNGIEDNGDVVIREGPRNVKR